MELYIGGHAQGKLHYVLQNRPVLAEQVWDGAAGEPWDGAAGFLAVNHLHALIERLVRQDREPEEVLYQILQDKPDIILISDITGSGIVPVDALERKIRERQGRVLCMLANRAERVERILCGLGQRIK